MLLSLSTDTDQTSLWLGHRIIICRLSMIFLAIGDIHQVVEVVDVHHPQLPQHKAEASCF